MINEQAETQLLELLRITPQVYALIDSEREAADAPLEAGRAGFARACERADVPCHILQRRAMENYFPESAVQRVKGPKHRALEPYQKLSECSPHWGKSENWRIASEMNLRDLQGTDLGQFLEELTASILSESAST